MSDTTAMYVIMCGGKFLKFVDTPKPDMLNITVPLLVDMEKDATHFTDKPLANWIASRICQVLQSSVALDNSYAIPFVVPISTKIRPLARYYAYRDEQLKDDVDLVRIDDKSVGDIVQIGGITWRVVDREECYDHITMAFCSEVILHSSVPFVVPSWDKRFVLVNPRPVNYKTSYVNNLCESLCDHMDRAFKVNNQPSMIINDLETGEFVHAPTKKQLEGEFTYFKSAENRKGLNFNGIATPYWTATYMSVSDCVYYVNEAGNIYCQYSPNHPNGFRPCFKIAFLKYQSINPTVKLV